MSKRMLPWRHFITYLKALVTVMCHRVILIFVLIIKMCKKSQKYTQSITFFRCLEFSFHFQMKQIIWQRLYYLKTYTFTTRREDNSLLKPIHFTLTWGVITTWSPVLQCVELETTNENKRTLAIRFFHVLVVDLYKIHWICFVCFLPSQKAGFFMSYWNTVP